MFRFKLVKKAGMVLLCASLLTGCGSADKKGSRISNKNNVDAVMESQIAAANEKSISNENAVDNTPSDNSEENGMDANNNVSEGANEPVSSDSFSGVYGENENVGNPPDESVDIDLTVMSSDMIYATVYQLVFESEDYVGKTIKMRGTYYASWYERTQKYYHCVIIKDATACCSQGMEFIWDDGSHIYPDEYPENETEVEVIGTFEIYTEDGYEYCRLRDASLQVINSFS